MNQKGFITQIILIIGALVALKYFFQFDLIDLLSDGNYGAAWAGIKLYVWDKFIIGVIWNNISQFVQNVVN